MGHSSERPDSRKPLRSEFATDPELGELVSLFINQLGDRIHALEAVFEEQEFDRLQSLAREIKGAGNGYGFPVLGEAAARLESALQDNRDVSSIRLDLEKLLALCRRIRHAA